MCPQIRDGRVGTWAFSYAFGMTAGCLLRARKLTAVEGAREYIVGWEHTSVESSPSIWMHGPMSSFRASSAGEMQEPTS